MIDEDLRFGSLDLTLVDSRLRENDGSYAKVSLEHQGERISV